MLADEWTLVEPASPPAAPADVGPEQPGGTNAAAAATAPGDLGGSDAAPGADAGAGGDGCDSCGAGTGTAGGDDAALAEKLQAEADTERPPLPEPLDENLFRHFAPLLRECQAYASLSGCRFRSGSFDRLPGSPLAADSAAGADSPSAEPSPSRGRDPAPRLAAKLSAMPTVGDFAARLRAGDQGLTEEVDRAFRIVMTESVRNAMQGMFQALEMFPPSPPPSGVDDEDCAYEDVSAPLPVVAQRLYNDSVRRVTDACGGPGRLERRAMTSAFIVDFAEGVGCQLPPVPDTQQGMLKELAARVADETARRGGTSEDQANLRNVFLDLLGKGPAGERLRSEARKWWSENWKAAVYTGLGMAVLGLATVASAVLSRRGEGQRRRADEDEDQLR